MYRNTFHSYGQPSLEKQVEDIVKRSLPQQAYSPQKQKRQKPLHSWCLNFNLPQGCSNPQAGSGCVDSTGKNLKHGCNVRKDGRTCNASDHNKLNHTG